MYRWVGPVIVLQSALIETCYYLLILTVFTGRIGVAAQALGIAQASLECAVKCEPPHVPSIREMKLF